MFERSLKSAFEKGALRWPYVDPESFRTTLTRFFGEPSRSSPRRRTRRVTLVILISTLALGAGAAQAATTSTGWSKPIAIEGHTFVGGETNIADVSCPSTSWCVAVDSNGDAVTWQNGSWTAPKHLNANGSLTAVSCATSSFCAVVSAAGTALTLSDGRWSAPQSLGAADSYRVSCPSITFCAAVGANGLPGKPSTIATFNGTKWTSHRTSTNGSANDRLLDVSCATAHYCVAVNYDGLIDIYNGTRWAPTSKSGPAGLTAVSCPSVHFCMAVSARTESAVVIRGRSWTSGPTIPGFDAAFAYAVSCASATRCVAMGLSGDAATWHRGTWSSARKVFAGKYQALVRLSCVPSDRCVAVDSSGQSSVTHL
jgi:hypothetical protein